MTLRTSRFVAANCGLLLALLASLAIAGCGSSGNIAGTPPDGGGVTGPLMAAGQDCLSCHTAGGAASGHPFTAAGTVFDSTGAGANGVTVDVGGVIMTSNAAGNFYTDQPITAFSASVAFNGTTVSMATPPTPTGACNSCHGVSTGQITTNGSGTTGPLMAPGQDCLSCHKVGGAASGHPFTAAGTVFAGSSGASGVAVTVGGVTMTSNAAGNFYTTAAIAFPAACRINGSEGESMQAGGCNACNGVNTGRLSSNP